MDFSKIPLFQGLVHKMGWLAQRQQVLARNIANANTPGFKPKDIEKPDFSALLEGPSRGSGQSMRSPQVQQVASVPLMVTNPAHIPAAPGDEETMAKEVEIDLKDAPKRISGNAVVLENELMKVGKTAMDYELSTSIYKRYVAMFKVAIGHGGS
jgi:flagellar basal-body rod protein FlgB